MKQLIVPVMMFFILSQALFAQADDTAALISEAEALQQEARDKLHAWVATTRFIDQARAAQSAGDTGQAREFAERAISLANASLAQATREAATWQTRALAGDGSQ